MTLSNDCKPSKGSAVLKAAPQGSHWDVKADDALNIDAILAIECLRILLSEVVDPIAKKLGFTREKTGCWSIVNVENPQDFPNLNPPRTFTRKDPFLT